MRAPDLVSWSGILSLTTFACVVPTVLAPAVQYHCDLSSDDPGENGNSEGDPFVR